MIVAVIPAKGSSSRLPNKNMRVIHGKTLVQRAVEFARASKKIDKIYLSTDSDQIEAHARELGVSVIRRGPELGGDVPLMEVFRHALEHMDKGAVTRLVGIQPDNPDRRADLDRAIEHAQAANIDHLFTVDRQGRHTGSFSVYSKKALTAQPYPFASSVLDDCTNIHTSLELRLAARNLSEFAHAVPIAGRMVGPGEPCYVVAEAACNHLCDMGLARKMIDEAAAAGADAVKFQTYKAERLVTGRAKAFWGGEKCTQVEYYRRLDRFGKDEYAELFAHAKQKKIAAFSSPFDEQSAKMLADLGAPAMKIASCEIPNLRFIRFVAKLGLPVILSTGASTFEEIDRAVETVLETGNFQLILLACTLSYPTQNQDANFQRIQTLARRYPGMITGISDHTEPDRHMVIPAVARVLGACMIEKHYTLDRTMTGSGHFFAVNPDDLAKMVENVRLAEQVLGDGTQGVADSEARAFESARRSVVAAVDIQKGQTVTPEMVTAKRPGGGIGAEHLDRIAGMRAAADVDADEPLSWDMLEESN